MKKIIYSALIFALLAALVSCKSTKGAGKSAEPKKNIVTSDIGTDVTDTEDEAGDEAGADEADSAASETAEASGAAEEAAPAKTDKKAEKASKKAAKKAAETTTATAGAAAGAAAAVDTNFVGWIKTTRRNITDKFGIIQLKIKSKIGSYSLSVLNEKDKPVNVLSTANEFVTNAFYLKNSKKVYNLVTDSTVASNAKRTKNGAYIIYEIPSVAQVMVDFNTFASEEKKDADMIKVTATIKNLSSRNDEFSLKAVLDTVLGEADQHHFYTWENVSVKNEVLYRTLQNQKWFVSKNVNAAMQLFYSGADCTAPDLVALANYSTLEKPNWEPDMLSYRAFDTVLSYNDSAVCAIWKSVKLAPSETSPKFIFYIAVAADGKSPTGEKYVYSKEFAQAPAEEKPAATPAAEDKPLEVITSNPSPVTGSLTENVKENPDETIAGDAAPVIPNVDFYIKNMTKDHLTPEYIQSLIDRISALEEDSPSLNRQELLQLNAELDAILTYLRQ